MVIPVKMSRGTAIYLIKYVVLLEIEMLFATHALSAHAGRVHGAGETIIVGDSDGVHASKHSEARSSIGVKSSKAWYVKSRLNSFNERILIT